MDAQSHNLAWLCSPQGARTLRPQAWRPQASPGRLSFFAPNFALNAPSPWLCGDEVTGSDLEPEPLPELRSHLEPSPAEFAQMHEDLLRRIQLQELQKAVPIVSEELLFAKPLNIAMFPAARQAATDQYAYGFALGEEGLAGVTPELLFEVQGDRLRTMALAGTGPVGGPSLLDDVKERREHQLVIDHILSEIGGEAGETRERSFGLLKHLYTPIEVRLQEPPDFMQLVVRLHPTAALGGWPRRPAVEWLQAQPFHRTRRRFGAPFGFTDGENMRCVVAIRCLQWEGARAWLASGCGVVLGSQALREWEELSLKRRATCRNLGLL